MARAAFAESGSLTAPARSRRRPQPSQPLRVAGRRALPCPAGRPRRGGPAECGAPPRWSRACPGNGACCGRRVPSRPGRGGRSGRRRPHRPPGRLGIVLDRDDGVRPCTAGGNGTSGRSGRAGTCSSGDMPPMLLGRWAADLKAARGTYFEGGVLASTTEVGAAHSPAV